MKKIEISNFWLVLGGLLSLGLFFGVGGNLGFWGGFLFLGAVCLANPKIALTLLVFSVALGEFGRVSAGNISLLLTDLLAFFTLISTLPYALKTKLPKPAWWLLGFIVVAFLSILGAIPVLETSVIFRALMYLARFIFFAGLVFTLPVFVQKTKIQNHLLKCVIWAAVLTALLGFGQLYFFPNFETLGLNESGWDPHIGRLTSTWLDPNYVGGYFAFVLTFLVSGLLKNREKYFIWRVVFTLILLVALYFTVSRSAYLALGVGLLVVAIFQARWLILAGFLGIVVVLGSGTRASERIWDMADSITAIFGSETTVLDPTSRLRIENWEEGLEVVAKYPFLGTGYGTYGEIQWREGNLSDQDAHHASGADSSLLTVWATTGTLGLIFYLGFLASLVISFLRNYKQPFFCGILAGLCGIFVHSFFVNSLFFTLILAGVVPVLALAQQKKRP